MLKIHLMEMRKKKEFAKQLIIVYLSSKRKLMMKVNINKSHQKREKEDPTQNSELIV